MNHDLAKEKDISYYLSLNYPCTLRKSGDCFVLFIRELAIMVQEKTLEDAYRKLVNEKEKYFKDMIDNGFEKYIVKPNMLNSHDRDFKRQYNIASSITPFLIKLTIIVLLIIGFGIISIDMTKKIGISIDMTTKKYGDPNYIYKQLMNQTEKLADMSVEQKAKIKSDIKKTVSQLKPFYDEIKVLFEEEKPSKRKK
jgi:hypothetical protein